MSCLGHHTAPQSRHVCRGVLVGRFVVIELLFDRVRAQCDVPDSSCLLLEMPLPVDLVFSEFASSLHWNFIQLGQLREPLPVLVLYVLSYCSNDLFGRTILQVLYSARTQVKDKRSRELKCALTSLHVLPPPQPAFFQPLQLQTWQWR
jgi:hypothetical protein